MSGIRLSCTRDSPGAQQQECTYRLLTGLPGTQNHDTAVSTKTQQVTRLKCCKRRPSIASSSTLFPQGDKSEPDVLCSKALADPHLAGSRRGGPSWAPGHRHAALPHIAGPPAAPCAPAASSAPPASPPCTPCTHPTISYLQ